MKYLFAKISVIAIWLLSGLIQAQTNNSESIPDAIKNGPPVAPIMVSLPLEHASEILDEALRIGRAEGMLPLTVVVLDSGGHMVAVKRQDGSGIFRIEVANAKAYGALGMGVSTRLMGQRLENRPVFGSALIGLSDGQWAPVPGGVLIRNEQGFVIGSVGISGDTSNKDEFAAINAIKKAGYWPEPLEPDESWRDSHL